MKFFKILSVSLFFSVFLSFGLPDLAMHVFAEEDYAGDYHIPTTGYNVNLPEEL